MSQSANGPKTQFLTALTDTKAEDVEGVGTLRQEGDKWYRWVKNDSGAAVAAGYLMCYQDAGGEAYHEVVYKPASANLHTLAGVAMAAMEDYDSSDLTKKCYGWIQLEGYYGSVLITATNTAIAVGDLMKGVNAVHHAIRLGAGSVGQTQASNATALVLGAQQIVAAASQASGSATATLACWLHCLWV